MRPNALYRCIGCLLLASAALMPLTASADKYHEKIADNLVKDAKYYQSLAERQQRDAEFYLRKAQTNQRDAAYYTRKGDTRNAGRCSRNAKDNLDKYNTRMRRVSEAQAKSANYLKLAEKELKKQ